MKIKSLIVLTALFFTTSSCKYLHIDAFSGSTLIWGSGANNYFNQEKASNLNTPKEILITGEVERDVSISLENIPWHSVAIKEARMSGDTVKFEGLFRYDGYALCDILSTVKVDKVSKETFFPPVDLYVEVWNDKGEFATFSWGEIFYSANMYQIIIAKNVTRVVPGKTGEKWTLPKNSKVVVGTDKFTVRNISDPVKIVIKSLKGDFIVNRNPDKFYSEALKLNGPDSLYASLSKLPENLPLLSFESVYYGHGMGYKGYKTFTGVSLEEVMKPYYPKDEKHLREGLICIEGVDGYRASFSLSELMNRNDQQEPLLMFGASKDKGYETFSFYAGCDMFADRSIKGVSKITLY